MGSRWDRRFFASTRGQVVTLLQSGRATVDELARALGLTDNAIRAHLSALERDGLVAQSGLRRGVGKPAYTYVLTPEAERLFPNAYGILLQRLLDVLAGHMPASALRETFRDVGHRLASDHGVARGDLGSRVEQAIELLAEMGGQAHVEEENSRLFVVGRNCPLSAAVTRHPDACLIAETLLADVIGVPVRQVCDPLVPRCRFEVLAPTTAD
jgi:predicted ArsR family transcriptional regulator